jgi:hypothetical protein
LAFLFQSKFHRKSDPVECLTCAIKLRRVQRKGFVQMHILPRLGFYPWECPVCRERLYYPQRDKQRSYPQTPQR